MAHISTRRDGAVVGLLAGLVAMLIAALAGWALAFAYSLVAVLGLFIGMGFVRRRDRLTWTPPALAVAALVVAMAGMFANADVPVTSPADTVGGFQAGTAYLVYGLWIPAFLIMGLGFSLLFDRLGDDADDAR